MRFFGYKRKDAFDLVVVGLGNPGAKYQETKHNIGYKVVDFIAENTGASVKRLKHYALIGKTSLEHYNILLVKPQTFMNDSGRCVKEVLDFYKLPADRLLIIFDDVMLDPGIIRIKRTGSAGGHNGIKSIIETIGDDFPRIKIGIGMTDNPDVDLADYVLSRFCSEDYKRIKQRFSDIQKAIILISGDEIDKAMNLYN